MNFNNHSVSGDSTNSPPLTFKPAEPIPINEKESPKTFNNVIDEICAKQYETLCLIREIRDYFLGPQEDDPNKQESLKGLCEQANLMNNRQDDILRNLIFIREMLGVTGV